MNNRFSRSTRGTTEKMDRVRHGFARITAEVVQQKTVLTRIAHKAPARLLPLKTAAATSAGAAR